METQVILKVSMCDLEQADRNESDARIAYFNAEAEADKAWEFYQSTELPYPEMDALFQFAAQKERARRDAWHVWDQSKAVYLMTLRASHE